MYSHWTELVPSQTSPVPRCKLGRDQQDTGVSQPWTVSPLIRSSGTRGRGFSASTSGRAINTRCSHRRLIHGRSVVQDEVERGGRRAKAISTWGGSKPTRSSTFSFAQCSQLPARPEEIMYLSHRRSETRIHENRFLSLSRRPTLSMFSSSA